jgi:hypothetical protein
VSTNDTVAVFWESHSHSQGGLTFGSFCFINGIEVSRQNFVRRRDQTTSVSRSVPSAVFMHGYQYILEVWSSDLSWHPSISDEAEIVV